MSKTQDPAGSRLAPMTGSAVFEMVDATDDETYFPMGFWPTLEVAIACIPDDPTEMPTDGYIEDNFTLEIREHKLGAWSGHGKKVFERHWARVFSDTDEDDDGRWVVKQNVNVDLPDTAAQDSASKSNNPAVSG